MATVLSVAEHLGVGVVDQGGDLILLEFQHHLRVAVCLAETQEGADAIVAGDPQAQTRVDGLPQALEHNAAGGVAATSDQVSGVTVLQQAGRQQGVVTHDVATAGGSVVDDHAHAVVGGNQFLQQPGGEGLRGDRVQGAVADFVKQVAGLLNQCLTLSSAPGAGVSDEGAEVGEQSGVQQGVSLRGVNPVKRPVADACLVLDTDGGAACLGVCLVAGATQVGHSLREHLVLVEQGDGVVLVSDARVVNGTVGLEGHGLIG